MAQNICSAKQEAEGGTPTPPPKFAVFHKKFAGNSKLKVRPIQSVAKHFDEMFSKPFGLFGCSILNAAF